MALWTVFEPAADEASTTRWAEDVTFVREGFSWAALFFAPIVLLRHRLWLALIGYFLIQGALAATLFSLDTGSNAFVLFALTHVAVALMLPDLRRGKLYFRGYEESGAVVATSLEQAEQRYFESRLSGKPAATERLFASAAPANSSRRAEPAVLGLFPEAGR